MAQAEPLEERARFRSMDESTKAEWQLLTRHHERYAAGLPDRVLDHLRLLGADYGGFAVDRLTHSLQSASLAERDGRDDEYVVCALLHDIGDTLCSYNHPDVATAILRPFVSEQNLWMVSKHFIFQGYYYFHLLGGDRDLREQYRDHAWFDHTAEFCESYDQCAFDPGYDTPPLEHFEPALRRVLAAPRPEWKGI